MLWFFAFAFASSLSIIKSKNIKYSINSYNLQNDLNAEKHFIQEQIWREILVHFTPHSKPTNIFLHFFLYINGTLNWVSWFLPERKKSNRNGKSSLQLQGQIHYQLLLDRLCPLDEK